MSPKTVYLVGMILPKYGRSESSWRVIGIFDDGHTALKACTTIHHFIGPLPLNQPLDLDASAWPGVYYPLAEAEVATRELA